MPSVYARCSPEKGQTSSKTSFQRVKSCCTPSKIPLGLCCLFVLSVVGLFILYIHLAKLYLEVRVSGGLAKYADSMWPPTAISLSPV